MRKYIFVVFLLIFFTACNPNRNVNNEPQQTSQKDRKLRDIIGVTHVRGGYYFTDKDYLNEGADQILELGSNVIKFWFFAKRHEYPAAVYGWNSPLWPPADTDSLVEGAKLPYYKELFNKPFKTYILTVTSLGQYEEYWINGITEDQQKNEEKQFYELTKYLLTAYKNTDKTFILQHWEGDWMIRGCTDDNIDPTPLAIKSMISWLNARQAGVDKARKEVGRHGVRVYHAAEINQVVSTMQTGRPNMVNMVLPYTNLDLVSYSAWDSILRRPYKPETLKEALDFIAQNMPDSNEFGDKNVYLGEFGIPENQFPQPEIRQTITDTVNTALDWQCPYIIYWQLYCNEPYDKSRLPITSNLDSAGFWLIRPDGTKTWAWHYFHDLLNPSQQKNN